VTAARGARWVAWLWAAVLFVGLSWPGEKLPAVAALSFDKLIHAVLFGVLFWLFVRSGSRPLRVALACAAFGALSEVWQHVLPFGRTGDVYDALANLTGVLVAWGAWAAAGHVRSSKRHAEP
jgi:VanZ family protein